jgi:excisionase family DNA binding protein
MSNDGTPDGLPPALALTYLQPCDVALQLGCSISTVYRLVDTGRLKASATTVRGGRLFTPATVAEYLERLEASRG